MKYPARFAKLALAPLLLLSAPALAGSQANWDGTWNGSQGKKIVWPVSVSIAGGKVVGYSQRGVSFPVRYSDVSQSKVSFGDRDNYVIVLRKTGDGTASGEIHGRRGEGPVSLTKQ